ncbi:hypothetical protein [Nostoc punctiforme]|uniref:Uncharacterized protein n=1 Tax=Nostoc punctiforme (strain ATCC 29133 / PCC 73102) TaxID=63737 RepID=B2IWM4_NOSP7|nr:hypothetical protein [Nostoc punctiforme]ACC81478.1 hypothetical protein Npun_F2947 [Nostoc punctiforme PCC 73102]
MSLKTRGSAAVDKAQRRLALLKSINENLDLGHGLTIEAYTRFLDNTRATLEAHNTLLSNLEESRKTMNQMDRGLSELSERMLSAVATVYGKNSMEYSKAGGSSRKRSTSKKSISQVPIVVTVPVTQPTQTVTNGKGSLSNF